MNTNPRHVIFGTGAIGLATLDALRRRGRDRAAGQPLRHRSGPRRRRDRPGRRQRPGLHHRRRRGRPGRLPDPQPALPPVGGVVPRPAGRRARRRRSHRRPAGQHGERLHVRPPGRTAPHRDPPVRGPHQEGAAARPDGPRAAGRAPGRTRRGRHRPGLGLLRPPRRRPVQPGRPGLPAALAGKTATVLGDPDQPHTYTYLPDIGEGLAVLGEHPDAPGEVWHLPNDPDTRTTRQLVDSIYRQAGQPRTRLRGTPALLLRALGVVNPTVRELVELQYEFQEPFVVDSSKIATKLGVHATPLEQALADTLASYPTGT